MTNDERYKKYKLKGLLDNKELYKETHPEYNKKETIAKVFTENFQITADDYDKYVKEYGDIPQIKAKFYDKRKEGGFNDNIVQFYNWFKSIEKCCYCGVKKDDLDKYFNDENKQYKNARQRGKTLEIERIQTAPKDKNVYTYDNCNLACYICNNAKSDFLSPKDFKVIAEGINKFWNSIDTVEAEFPEKSDIWNK